MNYVLPAVFKEAFTEGENCFNLITTKECGVCKNMEHLHINLIFVAQEHIQSSFQQKWLGNKLFPCSIRYFIFLTNLCEALRKPNHSGSVEYSALTVLKKKNRSESSLKMEIIRNLGHVVCVFPYFERVEERGSQSQTQTKNSLCTLVFCFPGLSVFIDFAKINCKKMQICKPGTRRHLINPGQLSTLCPLLLSSCFAFSNRMEPHKFWGGEKSGSFQELNSLFFFFLFIFSSEKLSK